MAKACRGALLRCGRYVIAGRYSSYKKRKLPIGSLLKFAVKQSYSLDGLAKASSIVIYRRRSEAGFTAAISAVDMREIDIAIPHQNIGVVKGRKTKLAQIKESWIDLFIL